MVWIKPPALQVTEQRLLDLIQLAQCKMLSRDTQNWRSPTMVLSTRPKRTETLRSGLSQLHTAGCKLQCDRTTRQLHSVPGRLCSRPDTPPDWTIQPCLPAGCPTAGDGIFLLHWCQLSCRDSPAGSESCGVRACSHLGSFRALAVGNPLFPLHAPAASDGHQCFGPVSPMPEAACALHSLCGSGVCSAADLVCFSQMHTAAPVASACCHVASADTLCEPHILTCRCLAVATQLQSSRPTL